MLLAAALVPPTGLLVPGVAGRADVLPAERAAAVDAVGAMLARRPERVVVLRDRGPGVDLAAPGAGTLRAAGVPDGAWLPGGHDGVPSAADVPATVALWLLGLAGWTGEVLVRAAAGRVPGDLVREVGADASDRARVAFLLVGGGSVRRGPDAPLADDPRAAEVDAGLVAWLAGLGDEGAEAAGPGGAVAPTDEDVVRHGLDVVGPARVLAAALPGSGLGRGRIAATVPLGATYLVGTWLPAPADGPVEGPIAQAAPVEGPRA